MTYHCWGVVRGPGTCQKSGGVYYPFPTQLSLNNLVKKQTAAIKSVVSAQGGEYGERKVFGKTVVVTWPNGTIGNFKYLCLPDTVDPRGPKGK
jgi:hypothetical protein